jgi:hypothetical protein
MGSESLGMGCGIQSGEAMTELILFTSTFVLVFALGLQSLNVNNGHHYAAAVTSFAIGAMQMVLFKLAPNASWMEIAAFLLGGIFGEENGFNHCCKRGIFRPDQSWHENRRVQALHALLEKETAWQALRKIGIDARIPEAHRHG